jgi:hypothetical protein
MEATDMDMQLELASPQSLLDAFAMGGTGEFTSFSHSVWQDDTEDFDYVIELREDPEYRKVAEELARIHDYDELNIDDVLNSPNQQPAKYHSVKKETKNTSDDVKIITINMDEMFDKEDEGDERSDQEEENDIEMGTGILFPSENGPDSPNPSVANSPARPMIDPSAQISKRSFTDSMKLMRVRQNWVYGAARRSSLEFSNQYQTTDKVASNKFLVALAGGVQVRRHQANYSSELVRLFSEDGCVSIKWGRCEDSSNYSNLLMDVPNGVTVTKKQKSSCCGLLGE